MNGIRALLGGGVSSYHPQMARLLNGSVAAAIFIEHIAFWQERSEDGWVFRTQEEIEERTALTRKVQETARALLLRMDIIEESRNGVPPRMYYRIKWDNLEPILQTVREVPTVPSRSDNLKRSNRDNISSTSSSTDIEQPLNSGENKSAAAEEVHGWHFEEYLRDALKGSDIPLTRSKARRYTGEANKLLKEGVSSLELYEACDRVISEWQRVRLSLDDALRDLRNDSQSQGKKPASNNASKSKDVTEGYEWLFKD